MLHSSLRYATLEGRLTLATGSDVLTDRTQQGVMLLILALPRRRPKPHADPHSDPHPHRRPEDIVLVVAGNKVDLEEQRVCTSDKTRRPLFVGL